jgi:hypothetical protein
MKRSELLLAMIGISVVTLVVTNQVAVNDYRSVAANAHVMETIKQPRQPRASNDGRSCLQYATIWDQLQRRDDF